MNPQTEVAAMFTTIVVGVDGLQGGRDALALARRIGELAGGELVAVHVHPYEPFPLRGLRLDIEALAREDAQALLDGQLAEAGVRARAIVTAETSPGRGLHRIADELEADLVVIGAPHRGPVGRVVAGDTARAVIQGATRPTLVARPGAAERFDGPVVGVGYNGSPESQVALDWAGHFATAVGGTVRVRSVAEPPQGFSPSISYGVNWVALVPERREYAEGLVARAVAELGDGATGEAIVGVAKDELVELSEQVDLLVLGSRGYGPVRRALLGGSSDRVVHAAACPVVVVPRGAHHEEEPAERSAPAQAAAR
jgi:nucleotide-binding universal stress UspA family protein